jgi:hypothetical protein
MVGLTIEDGKALNPDLNLRCTLLSRDREVWI